MIARIIDYYKEHSKRERMGRMVERLGFEKVQADLLS